MIQTLEPVVVVNISGERRRFAIATDAGVAPKVHDLAPGDSAEIAGAYGVRRQTAPGRELLPSIVENLTGGMVVPDFDPRAKAILEQKARELAAEREAARAQAPQGKQAR